MTCWLLQLSVCREPRVPFVSSPTWRVTLLGLLSISSPLISPLWGFLRTPLGGGGLTFLLLVSPGVLVGLARLTGILVAVSLRLVPLVAAGA